MKRRKNPYRFYWYFIFIIAGWGIIAFALFYYLEEAMFNIPFWAGFTLLLAGLIGIHLIINAKDPD